MNKIIFHTFVLIFALANLTFSQLPIVKVNPSETYIELSEVGEIFVRVENISGLRAYSIKLSYDSQKLRCLSVTRETFFSNWNTFFFALVDSNASMINVDEAILGLGHESGSGDLFKVKFLALAQGDVGINFVNADLRDSLNNLIVVEIENGVVHIVNPTSVEEVKTDGTSFSIMAYPNPFNSSTRIEFNPKIGEEVEFSISSISGERVFSAELQSQGNNHISFIWNGKDMNGKVLPSGIYFINARTKNETKNFKLIMLK